MVGRMWIAAALLGAVLWAPRAALAGEWPRPLDGRVALAYAELWTDASGKTCTHGGVDLEAPSGTRVNSCAGGRVTFAGRVPSAAGGTVLAVSVVTPDGLRVTYLPLAACAVAPGGEVAAGEPIGELAGSGDASLASPHLHLSVHRGEAPIDPATLLLEPVPAGAAVPPPAVGSGVAAPPAAPGAPAPTSRVGVEPRPATAPGPASIAVAPPAVGRALSIEGIRVSDGLGPQTEVRIRPLPYELRFDVRAALTEAREVASAGRGFAARVLLALLAALLFARIARAASRGAAGMSELSPVLARARRVRR